VSNVTLKVYNILGQEVETLIDGEYLNGQCNIEWDGSYYGSGVYFYRISTDSESRTGKMMLAK
jgi:flagellar hook assembly protein FlgD